MAGEPTFMPHDLGQYSVAYFWMGYGGPTMPWGELGNQPDPAWWSPQNSGLTDTDTSDTGTPIFTPAEQQEVPDLVRGPFALPLDYQPAMHLSGSADILSWGDRLTLPNGSRSTSDEIVQWRAQSRGTLFQMVADRGGSSQQSGNSQPTDDARPVYGPPAPPTRDELEAQAREEAIQALVKQVYMDGLVAQLRQAMADDPAYKQLMSYLENDQRIAEDYGGANTRSAEERLAIELGYFYGVIQGQIQAIRTAKSSVWTTRDEYFRLDTIQQQLEEVRSSIKTAYKVLGLSDVVVRGQRAGADAAWPYTIVGTGIQDAASAARYMLMWGNNSIQPTGDEGFIVDAAALLGKGLVKGVAGRAMSLLSRFAASFADDAARVAVAPAVKAVAPKVTQIMQSLVDQAVADLASSPQLLARTMGKGALRRVANKPQLAEAEFGKAVEKLVANRIEGNPALKSLFIRANQRAANGQYRSIYDFAGIGRGQGLLFDVTTRRDLIGHAGRWYSDLVEFIVYDFPQGLRFPPP